MILQAWLTLPSCLASSSRPTLLRMTFWSFVIVGSPLAPPPGRGDIAPPRRLSAHRYHLIRQIKSRLLQHSVRVPLRGKRPMQHRRRRLPPPAAPSRCPALRGSKAHCPGCSGSSPIGAAPARAYFPPAPLDRPPPPPPAAPSRSPVPRASKARRQGCSASSPSRGAY